MVYELRCERWQGFRSLSRHSSVPLETARDPGLHERDAQNQSRIGNTVHEEFGTANLGQRMRTQQHNCRACGLLEHSDGTKWRIVRLDF